MQNIKVSINLDTTPILYTDNINIIVNTEGVVLDVMQRIGPTNQNRIVARIGMSKDHAKRFLKRLGEILLKSEGEILSGEKVVN